MQLVDDMGLLREYAMRGSEQAFETLVQRHVNLVYSAAYRRVHDPVLAAEVSQTVFIILAKKAHSLSPKTVLSGWLYRTAQLAAGHALRAACRRRKHEKEAALMLYENPETTDSAWELIAPFLEEAMSRLCEADRNVVVLRYFENKDFKTVGAAMGASENTAQKRAARAVDKLRVFLVRRGVVLSVSAVTAALSANAVQAAPHGLAASASAASLSAPTSTSSTATILKGTLKLMAWTKLKTVAVFGIAALLAGGGTVAVMKMRKPADYYSWDVHWPTVASLEKSPPQVSILPTKFDRQGSEMMWGRDGKSLGIDIGAKKLIECAFRGIDDNRTKVDVHLPAQRYDFITSLHHGASNGLAQAVMSKFKIVASHQMIETNVLVLTVREPNAPGMKPPHEGDPKPAPNGPGHHASNSEGMHGLIHWLEGREHFPIVDQTGVSSKFAYDLAWDEPNRDQENEAGLRKVLADQLGLELNPDVQPVNMLVISKAK